MPQLDYRYAYLFGNIFILLPIWVYLFIKRKDLWKEIVMVSLICGVFGPLSEFWYVRDYWKPEYASLVGLEDFLFGFFAGGIGCSIYEEFFGKRFAKRENRKQHWTWWLLPMSGVAFFTLNFFNFQLGLNSIYASMVMFLVVASIMFKFRKDLCVDAFWSAILTTIGGFMAYQALLFVFPELITRWWYMKGISGILVYKVPLEELLWAFTFGLVVGPSYEFFMGLKFRK